jgi:hypothetical protein
MGAGHFPTFCRREIASKHSLAGRGNLITSAYWGEFEARTLDSWNYSIDTNDFHPPLSTFAVVDSLTLTGRASVCVIVV